MATIQVGGLASGLDTTTLIQKLLAVEQQPVTLYQTQQAKLRAISTAYTDLNTKLLALKYKAEAVGDSASFFSRSVTSSQDTVATASAAQGTSKGTYTLTVTGLARGSIAVGANTVDATTDTVATGNGTFDFKLGDDGAVQSVAVSAATTLDDLVAAINTLNAGVRAAAVNIGTAATPAYELTLTSTGTGEANNIEVVTDGTTLGVPLAGANAQTAGDATFSVSGLGSFTRSTNTFSDVIDGVTITLKASSGSTDLVVDYDKSGIQARVQNLVDAYNSVVLAIDGQTKVTTNTDGSTSSGAFTGDALPGTLRRSLALIAGNRVSSAFQTLASIGIVAQRDGSLALDASKFQAALDSNPQAVSDLFAGPSGNDTGGIADALAAKAEAATTALTGSIALRQDGITQNIKRIQDQIDATSARIQTHQDQLQAQFANLEQVIARLQSTSSFLTAQLKSLQNFGASSQ